MLACKAHCRIDALLLAKTKDLVIARIVKRRHAAGGDRQPPLVREERVMAVVLRACRRRRAKVRWPTRASIGGLRVEKRGAGHARCRVLCKPGYSCLQRIVEHVADHQHSAARPLPHSAQFRMFELSLVPPAAMQSRQHPGHGFGAEIVALRQLLHRLAAPPMSGLVMRPVLGAGSGCSLHDDTRKSRDVPRKLPVTAIVLHELLRDGLRSQPVSTRLTLQGFRYFQGSEKFAFIEGLVQEHRIRGICGGDGRHSPGRNDYFQPRPAPADFGNQAKAIQRSRHDNVGKDHMHVAAVFSECPGPRQPMLPPAPESHDRQAPRKRTCEGLDRHRSRARPPVPASFVSRFTQRQNEAGNRWFQHAILRQCRVAEWTGARAGTGAAKLARRRPSSALGGRPCR